MRSEFSTMDAPAGVATPYAFAAALLVLWLLASFFSPQNLRHIPTEGGPSLPILSLIGLYNFLSNGPEVLRRGYERHKGGAFKVALMSRWLVILSGKKLVDELQKLPDDTVTSATMEVFDMQHVFGRPYHTDQMHIPLLRALTRRLGAVFPDMFAEVQAAFGELVPATPDGWTPVHVFPLASTVVARATGRVFVGLPICRDPGYVRLITHFTDDATEALKMLTLAPAFLKGAVARRYTVVDARVREMMGYLRPAVDARMALAAQFGAEWADKPDDLLQGIIDAVVARGQGLHAAPAVRRLPGDRDDLRGRHPRALRPRRAPRARRRAPRRGARRRRGPRLDEGGRGRDAQARQLPAREPAAERRAHRVDVPQAPKTSDALRRDTPPRGHDARDADTRDAPRRGALRGRRAPRPAALLRARGQGPAAPRDDRAGLPHVRARAVGVPGALPRGERAQGGRGVCARAL